MTITHKKRNSFLFGLRVTATNVFRWCSYCCHCLTYFCSADVSAERMRNKEVQDLSFSQTSSFSDVFINQLDDIEKISRIKESLHKAGT
jgi:hypothetical protein